MTTLCSSQQWQCEAARPPTHLDPQALAAIQKAKCSVDHDDELLRYYGNFWSYQSKLVLVDKEPFPGLYCALSSRGPYLLHSTPFTLPGVAALEPNFVVMWRPWCIGVKLSSFSRRKFNEALSSGLNRLFTQFHLIAESHQRIASIPGTRVLLISYAQLIWDTERLTRRLLDFLPCLQSLKSDFVPRLGVDIVANNSIKVHSSIVQFGISNDPSACCNYSIRESRCGTKLPVDYYTTLPSKDGRCEEWCEDHTSSWLLKCTWETRACNACSQCGFEDSYLVEHDYALPLDEHVKRFKEEEAYLLRHTAVL